MLAQLRRAQTHLPYEWSSFGYEILASVDPCEYDLVGVELVLRHNSQCVFRRTIQSNSSLQSLLKELEQEGKASGNKHIGGFCCVGERTKIGEVTVRSFVERNLRRLLRGMAKNILQVVTGVYQEPEPLYPQDCEMMDNPPSPAPPPLITPPQTMSPSPAPPSHEGEPDASWPLLLYCSPDRACDTQREWVNFLLMCQAIGRTLGVSHQEAVYHNCIKMEMTRRQIPHISHFHCMQRMPGGDVAKIGELDLMVELRCGHYLVELKACTNWRRYENQVKKYINACHSMGYKAHGAAILNFNPKGVIECAMYDATCHHAPAPAL
eukprot:764867-Hanusia_phi.AAC.9